MKSFKEILEEEINPEKNKKDSKKLKIGAKVKVHGGKYKNQIGKIVDWDDPDEDDDDYQFHVKMDDGQVRFFGEPDVSFA